MSLYEMLVGPCLKVCLVVFAGGMLGHVFWYVRGLDWRKDRLIYHAAGRRGLAGAIWSVFAWMTPFVARGSRSRPFAALACWSFHAGLILVAVLLPGHAAIRRQVFGYPAVVDLPMSLPAPLADALTVLALTGLGLLALRRVLLPEARFLSTWRDWALLGLCGLVLGTGMLARLWTGAVSVWLLAHVILSELLLILAPFTRLSHMVLFFLSRGQLGMDYAVKRGDTRRGALFPW